MGTKRWRKRLLQTLIVMLIGTLVVTSSAFVNLLTWGITAAVPADSGDRIDAIVVLGRGPALREERLELVQQIWRDERSPVVFASGMSDAREILKHLEKSGISPSALVGERCSQTTEENGLFTSAVLRPLGVDTILLVTDPLHMWRSLLIFRSVGFDVVPHPTRLVSGEVSTQQELYRLGREYTALAYYALTGKFFRRSPEKLDNPPAEVRRKIRDWNCKVYKI